MFNLLNKISLTCFGWKPTTDSCEGCAGYLTRAHTKIHHRTKPKKKANIAAVKSSAAIYGGVIA